MTPRRKKVLQTLGSLAGVVVLGVVVATFVLDLPRPHGVRGAEAERMTDAIRDTVNADAWERTHAVTFTFRGRSSHLWDRVRDYDRVRIDDTEVLLRVDNRTGIAREHGRVARGKRARELVDRAYATWANDTFWLNPIAKLRDAGVTREVVVGEDGIRRLFVSYASGGVTPGDAYLWTPGVGGAPPGEWRMWVSSLPLGGQRATWGGWVTLATGARVATRHRVGPFTVDLSGVRGTTTLRELGGAEDPFAPLVRENQRNAEPAAPH